MGGDRGGQHDVAGARGGVRPHGCPQLGRHRWPTAVAVAPGAGRGSGCTRTGRAAPAARRPRPRRGPAASRWGTPSRIRRSSSRGSAPEPGSGATTTRSGRVAAGSAERVRPDGASARAARRGSLLTPRAERGRAQAGGGEVGRAHGCRVGHRHAADAGGSEQPDGTRADPTCTVDDQRPAAAPRQHRHARLRTRPGDRGGCDVGRQPVALRRRQGRQRAVVGGTVGEDAAACSTARRWSALLGATPRRWAAACTPARSRLPSRVSTQPRRRTVESTDDDRGRRVGAELQGLVVAPDPAQGWLDHRPGRQHLPSVAERPRPTGRPSTARPDGAANVRCRTGHAARAVCRRHIVRRV